MKYFFIDETQGKITPQPPPREKLFPFKKN